MATEPSATAFAPMDSPRFVHANVSAGQGHHEVVAFFRWRSTPPVSAGSDDMPLLAGYSASDAHSLFTVTTTHC
jgi:hypothetical protein